MSGLWDTAMAAERMGLEYRTALRRLHELHEQHGGLLFRAEGGAKTHLRVDPERLMELDETVRCRASDRKASVADLERRVAELEDFRRKALKWLEGPRG